MAKKSFKCSNKIIDFRNEETFFEALRRAKVKVSSSCGGFGTCTACRIWVDRPELLEERNEAERERAEERNFTRNERLSCQCLAVEGVSIQVPGEDT